jgi:ABC-type multidrug transport system ATPase subunit
MSTQAAIEVSHLTKVFGTRTAVRDVSGSAAEDEIRQRISITTEAPGLYNRLTVAENLEFFARLYGLPGRAARVYDALSAVGLTSRADDLCGSLSKGLKQRASLARSLLNEPEVMFLDEPSCAGRCSPGRSPSPRPRRSTTRTRYSAASRRWRAGRRPIRPAIC